MALIHRKKQKTAKIIFAGIITLALMGIVIFLVFTVWNKDKKSTVPENITHMEETTSQHIEEQPEYAFPYKEYYIDYIYVGDGQKLGNFVDIHIRFPDGEDFIVVAGKTITNQTKGGFYMYLDEKDIHMLSSAKTDKEVYEGTELYLASYKLQDSKGVVDYPWNQYVISSFGITYEDYEETYNRRMQLEENLLAFMEKTLQK